MSRSPEVVATLMMIGKKSLVVTLDSLRRLEEALDEPPDTTVGGQQLDALLHGRTVVGRAGQKARLGRGTHDGHLEVLGQCREQRLHACLQRLNAAPAEADPVVEEELQLHRPIERLDLGHGRVNAVLHHMDIADIQRFRRGAGAVEHAGEDLNLLRGLRHNDGRGQPETERRREEQPHDWSLH